MKISVSTTAFTTLATPLLVVPVADHGSEKTAAPELLTADATLTALAAPLIAGKDITGKFAEATWLLSPAGVKAQRVLFLGAGKANKFGLTELRNLAGTAARIAKGKNIKCFTLVLPNGIDAIAGVRVTTEGLVDRKSVV